MKKIRLLVIAGLFFVLLAVPPAVSHDGCVAQGEDVGCSYENDNHLDICDREPDGNYVSGQYLGANGLVYGTGFDETGYGGGCLHVNPTRARMLWFKVCEHNGRGPIIACATRNPA